MTYPQAGKNRVTRVALNGSTRLVADGLAGQQPRPPLQRRRVQRRRRTTASRSPSATIARPSDIGIAEGNGAVRRLTSLNADLQSKSLGQMRKLPVTSSYDQRPIDAWMVTAARLRPVAGAIRLILEIHGGPQTAYGDNFSTDVQLYAAAGYVVLYTNPRGSTSYGEDVRQPHRQGLSRPRL